MNAPDERVAMPRVVLVAGDESAWTAIRELGRRNVTQITRVVDEASSVTEPVTTVGADPIAVRDAVAAADAVVLGPGAGHLGTMAADAARTVGRRIVEQPEPPVVVADDDAGLLPTLGLEPSSYVAVSLGEDALAWADPDSLLSASRDLTGLPVVVLGGESTTTAIATLPAGLPLDQTAAVVRGAALLVTSSSLHARLAFGAAVPTLMIADQPNADVTVAAARVGLSPWQVSAAALAEPVAADAVAETWRRRREIVDWLGERGPEWRAQAAQAWEHALSGGDPTPVMPVPGPVPVGDWVGRNADIGRIVGPGATCLGQVRSALAALGDSVTRLEVDVSSLARERAAALDKVSALEAALVREQEAAAAARDLVGRGAPLVPDVRQTRLFRSMREAGMALRAVRNAARSWRG